VLYGALVPIQSCLYFPTCVHLKNFLDVISFTLCGQKVYFARVLYVIMPKYRKGAYFRIIGVMAKTLYEYWSVHPCLVGVAGLNVAGVSTIRAEKRTVHLTILYEGDDT